MWLLLVGLVAPLVASTQAGPSGCTDPQASNFNPAAASNDGSCTYAVQSYSPPALANLPAALHEVSGAVYYQGQVVMLNDGGNAPHLYFTDTANGRIKQVVVLQGVSNVDWEELAQDSSFLYVGDIGNNASGNRQNLVIYKVPKAAIGQSDTVWVADSLIGRIRFAYEDQTDFSAQPANQTRFDAESMVYHRGQLHLFTKNWVGSHSVHYVLPTDTGFFMAQRLDSLNTGGYRLTAAASGAHDLLAFTGYTSNGNCALFLVYGFDSSAYFFNTGCKRRINLPTVLTMGQLEAICFFNATRGWMAGERFSQGFITVSQRIRRFSTLSFILDYYRQNAPMLPAAGSLRYNSTLDCYEVFTGDDWDCLGQ